MQRSLRTSHKAALAIVLLAAGTGCKGPIPYMHRDDPLYVEIAGKWLQKKGTGSLEFVPLSKDKKVGSLIVIKDGQSLPPGSYQYLDTDRVELTVGGMPTVVTMVVNNDELLVTAADGMTLTEFRKVTDVE